MAIPTVSGVMINGTYGGSSVASKTPTITWLYDDADAQAQTQFQVVISLSSSLTSPLYDSANVTSSVQSCLAGKLFTASSVATTLPSHVLLYVGVRSNNPTGWSSFAIESFKISNAPKIILATVDDRVNPLNVNVEKPTFTWEYEDLDGDPLSGYEIRVADNDEDLGTDSFVGNVWHPGPVTYPEAHQTKLGQDGTFPGCYISELLIGVKYYFQVMVWDQYDRSAWWTGYFKRNNPPSATDVEVLPAAPFKSDDLFASYVFVDDPGDTESDQTQIRWYVRRAGEASFSLVPDLNDQKTVPHSQTRGGDQWKFTVRPHDGVEYGAMVSSSAVMVTNRPPQATALGIKPARPKTSDNLTAVFALSDPDGDSVTARIKWYRNDEEVAELRNSATVPASFTELDDSWYFTVTPMDDTDSGAVAKGPAVTIGNTPPGVIAMMVEGRILPFDVATANPTIGWRYADDDGQPQKAFQMVLGTRPLRTKAPASSSSKNSSRGMASNGIISTAGSGGEVTSGADVFDSGVVEADLQFLQYATEDFIPAVAVGAGNAKAFNGCVLNPDLATMQLADDRLSGTVTFAFPGQTAAYETVLTYLREAGKRASYKLLVDGVEADTFISDTGTTPSTHRFKASQVSTGASITLAVAPVDPGAKAAFTTLNFEPLEQVEKLPGKFALSGYQATDDGGIKLAGLAGTATTAFDLPGGTYDIELVYVTETVGNPTLSLSVNNTVALTFAYETGAKVRSRFIKSVSINAGDTIKISGARNGGAAARVRKLVFRPRETVKTGAKLQPGIRYYASVKVYDGKDWSDWATTRFIMKGTAWASVSNAKGWTIEARFDIASTAVAATTTTTGNG